MDWPRGQVMRNACGRRDVGDANGLMDEHAGAKAIETGRLHFAGQGLRDMPNPRARA